MSNTDFIDDDLIRRRDAVREVKIGPGQQGVAGSDAPRSDAVPAAELNLTPLARRKEELNSQVATKMDELERLRARQESLEREKSTLEHLRSNQEKYEAGKREMIDHLEKSLVALDRESVSLNQRLALLGETEARFKDMLQAMRGFSEETWPADSAGLRDALSKALVIIETTRKEYNQATARVEALRESRVNGLSVTPLLAGGQPDLSAVPRRFGDCLRAGFAFSLPLIIVLVALIVLLVIRGL